MLDFTNDRIDDVGACPTALRLAAGTRIETAEGFWKVEELRRGDMVKTRDEGLQTVIALRHEALGATGQEALVFAPGAVGNGRMLVMSPGDLVPVTGWKTELLFGKPEVLVPAEYFVNGRSVWRETRGGTWVELGLSGGQVIFVEGTALALGRVQAVSQAAGLLALREHEASVLLAA